MRLKRTRIGAILQFARAMKARDSTSFPAANCFASSPRAVIRRSAPSPASENHVRKSSTRSTKAFQFQRRERSGTGLHQPHRAREKSPRADRFARQSRRRSRARTNTSRPVSSENKFGIALDRIATVYERAAKMRNIESRRRADAHRFADHRGCAVCRGDRESRADSCTS